MPDALTLPTSLSLFYVDYFVHEKIICIISMKIKDQEIIRRNDLIMVEPL